MTCRFIFLYCTGLVIRCRYVSICLVWHHGILFLYVIVKVLWFQENLIVTHLRATVNCSLFSLALHFCSWSSECYVLYTGSVFYPVPEHCCYCGWVITWEPCVSQEFRAHSSSAFHVNYLTEGSWSGDQHLVNRSCTFWKYSSTHNRALVMKNY